MNWTDTHTHLYSEAFDDDRKQMIRRAQQQGVRRFFIPAIDSSYHASMYALEKDYPDAAFLMMGLHPTHVKENYKEELTLVKQELDRRPFYAVGEIGIDLYWDQSTLAIQQDAFRTQIQWAKAFNYPIVIHCRDAFDEVFEVLAQEKDDQLFGIFHCFTGTFAQAKRALDFNMKLGIGGVATFKNGKIDQFLDQIPLEHIVLETDAPYLAPSPFRGKRNESAYLIQVAEKLASIYDLPLQAIAEQTNANADAVFLR
ncbi:TatD family hydrolase [Croceiramulus getboli]|nr:TatD family hydrolase [Flavobacteriaceae bacterium YJPT1-3]